MLIFSRGAPYQMQANMTGSATQYCHSIQRHDRLSEYQPSSEAATFCDNSEFIT